MSQLTLDPDRVEIVLDWVKEVVTAAIAGHWQRHGGVTDHWPTDDEGSAPTLWSSMGQAARLPVAPLGACGNPAF